MGFWLVLDSLIDSFISGIHDPSRTQLRDSTMGPLEEYNILTIVATKFWTLPMNPNILSFIRILPMGESVCSCAD